MPDEKDITLKNKVHGILMKFQMQNFNQIFWIKYDFAYYIFKRNVFLMQCNLIEDENNWEWKERGKIIIKVIFRQTEINENLWRPRENVHWEK